MLRVQGEPSHHNERKQSVPTPDDPRPDTITLQDLAFPETVAPAAIGQALAGELQINPEGVVRTLALLDDGNTVPFIARYRKEATGNLDEVQILAISDRAQALRTLHTRKHDVLRIIGEQGKLSSKLAGSIIESATVQAVEDLYMPYRPKRKTRASVARERGLEPLADLIVGQDHTFASALDAAASFVNPELGVESAESALAGARDICAETIMEDARVRGDARRIFFRDGLLTAKLTVDPEQASDKDPKGVYRLYYD